MTDPRASGVTNRGNLDYKQNGKRYGGAVKKIRRLSEADEKIQQILRRIEEIRKEIG